MNNNVILVNETIFTQSIQQLYDTLTNSLTTLSDLEKGVDKEIYENAIQDLKTVKEVLGYLSEKDFYNAIISSINLDE